MTAPTADVSARLFLTPRERPLCISIATDSRAGDVCICKYRALSTWERRPVRADCVKALVTTLEATSGRALRCSLRLYPLYATIPDCLRVRKPPGSGWVGHDRPIPRGVNAHHRWQCHRGMQTMQCMLPTSRLKALYTYEKCMRNCIAEISCS